MPMISYVTFLMPQKTMAYKLVMEKVDSPYLHSRWLWEIRPWILRTHCNTQRIASFIVLFQREPGFLYHTT